MDCMAIEFLTLLKSMVGTAVMLARVGDRRTSMIQVTVKKEAEEAERRKDEDDGEQEARKR